MARPEGQKGKRTEQRSAAFIIWRTANKRGQGSAGSDCHLNYKRSVTENFRRFHNVAST